MGGHRLQIETARGPGLLGVPKENCALLNSMSASITSPGRYHRPNRKVSATATVDGVTASTPGRNPLGSENEMEFRPSPRIVFDGPERVPSSTPVRVIPGMDVQ